VAPSVGVFFGWKCVAPLLIHIFGVLEAKALDFQAGAFGGRLPRRLRAVEGHGIGDG
jgi:hypothetical protein